MDYRLSNHIPHIQQIIISISNTLGTIAQAKIITITKLTVNAYQSRFYSFIDLRRNQELVPNINVNIAAVSSNKEVEEQVHHKHETETFVYWQKQSILQPNFCT